MEIKITPVDMFLSVIVECISRQSCCAVSFLMWCSVPEQVLHYKLHNDPWRKQFVSPAKDFGLATECLARA